MVNDQVLGTRLTADRSWDLLDDSTGPVVCAVMLEVVWRLSSRPASTPSPDDRTSRCPRNGVGLAEPLAKKLAKISNPTQPTSAVSGDDLPHKAQVRPGLAQDSDFRDRP